MNRDLTDGNITKTMLIFALPMIAGNLLQQLYNVADTFIVGQTIGATALSAVGSSYSLMVLLTSIILGLCMGSGVVFSQFYGAGRLEELRTSIFNAFFMIFLVSAVINTAAFLLLENCIIWLQIPKEAVAFTREYLQIIFIGIMATCVYNFFAAILRSIGNTTIPLLFLAVSAITNIILDLVFIVWFHMGVSGAAWATVIAQYLSSICIVVYFFQKASNLCPQRKHMHFQNELMRLVLSNSALTAIQQSIMNFGILLVQGLVNSFGFIASAAFAAVVKIDAFAYMPAQDFGNAFSTFIAQNYGARKPKRIDRGIKTAILLSSLFCVVSSLCVCLFAEPLMLLFVKPEETQILQTGIHYLYIEGSCYIGIGILFLLYGIYRGVGKAGMSIILTILSLGTRVALAYALSPFPSIGLTGIWVAVPIGWFLADLTGILHYCLRERRRIFLNAES